MFGARLFGAFVVVTVACGSSDSEHSNGGTGGATRGGTPSVSFGGEPASAGGSTSAGGTADAGGAGLGGSSSGWGGNAGTGANGGKNSGGHANGGRSSGGMTGTGGQSLPACVRMDDPDAPFVKFQRILDPAEPPTAGTIVSGTYFLSGFAYYGGTQQEGRCYRLMYKEILRFDATSATEGTFHSTDASMYEDGSGLLEHAQSHAYHLEGTALKGTYTCWEPYPFSEQYSATPTQIRFNRGPFSPNDCDKDVTLVLTYDLQP